MLHCPSRVKPIKSLAGEHAATTTLVLYHSRVLNGAQRAARIMRRELQPHRPCFRRTVQHFANLTAREDSYPAGATRMFHRLFGAARMLDNAADAFFMLESDLIPVRPFWLDALYHDAVAGGRFWVRGSILASDDLDKQVARKLSRGKNWLAQKKTGTSPSLPQRHRA